MRIQLNGNLERRIRTFFDYWRKRHAFINDLDISKHNHEANVLLWASIDALSNLWAKKIGKERCNNKGIKKENKRLIFDAFLAHYGGELFQIVSLPDLWNRIERDPKQLNLPKDVCVFLEKVGERRTPTIDETRRNRKTSNDLSLNEIIHKTLENYSITNYEQLEKSLTLSRYGSIAYKEMRTAYIHEGRPGSRSHSFDLSMSLVQPTYLSKIYTTPPVIGFSVTFMLCVLEGCINAFEAESLNLRQDPVPVAI
jgi:hypothetical protein